MVGLVIYGCAVSSILIAVEGWRRRLVLVMWGLRWHLWCCMSVVHPGVCSVLRHWDRRRARARRKMRCSISWIDRRRRGRGGDGLEVVGCIGHGDVALTTGSLHHGRPTDRFHWSYRRRRRRRLGWWGFLVGKISK